MFFCYHYRLMLVYHYRGSWGYTMQAGESEMAQDFGTGSVWSDNQDFGFQSCMIPRRTAIATACVRSAAPSFSMMCLM